MTTDSHLPPTTPAPPPRSHSMLPAHSPAPHIVIKGVTLFKRRHSTDATASDSSHDPSSHTTHQQQPIPPSPATATPDASTTPKSLNRPTTIGPDGKPTRIFPEMTLRNECAHLAAASTADVKNHIRLVHWPTKTIRIFCGLECPDLVTNGWRVIAVSHVWGNTKTNLIPGVPWHVPIADEKSFEAAFEGCHPKDLHWLDVLSIHQQSKTELAYSTKEMSVVFLRADAVCLWLPDTASPWPLLGSLNPSPDVMTGMIRRLAGETHLDPLVFPELRVFPSDPRPLTFIDLLTWLSDAYKDSWFARVWTTQEMALAKTLVFRGREFDLRVIREWHSLLNRAHTMVPKETLERLPLPDLQARGWHATDYNWRNRIDSKFLNSSQDLRESVQKSPKGCTLTEVHASVTVRGCSFMRDKVLTMAPILKCDLELPDFAFDDKSEELAERLWHHAVVKKMADGDISIVYDIVPGNTWREGGLWHPALNENGFGGRCPSFAKFRNGVDDLPPLDGVKKKANFLTALFKPRRSASPNPSAFGRSSRSFDVSRASADLSRGSIDVPRGSTDLAHGHAAFLTAPTPGAYFIDDLPYDFSYPTHPGTPTETHPALLRNVHLIECDAVWKKSDTKGWRDDADIIQTACEEFNISPRDRKRSEKMFARLHPQGLPRLYELTDGWHRGVAKVGNILAPFWMHQSFAPDPDEEPADAVWRTLKVMVVVPDKPRFESDARMRCWVVGGCGEEVPDSKINDFPGPYGAVWIDWDMVKKELGLKDRQQIDLTIQ
ncbi:hypothetical protein HDU96_011035 [Phlyctochytrium bullatum]|nr:hypothetical protein HDU96_011035 [Phlyctochytrium bullatum]